MVGVIKSPKRKQAMTMIANFSGKPSLNDFLFSFIDLLKKATVLKTPR